MQQGDFSSVPYYQFPHLQNPNSVDQFPNTYASAPPFTSGYASSDHTCPPYPQNSDPVPSTAAPTAPSFPPTSNPNLPSFNSPSQTTPFPPLDSHPSFQPPYQQQSYYPPYDHHQTAPDYAPAPSSVPPNSNSNFSYSSLYSAPYSHTGPSVPPIPSYESPFQNPLKPDHGGDYFDEQYGRFDLSHSDLYGKRQDSGLSRYQPGRDEVYGDGVYPYEGGKLDPYGARGTAPNSSSWSAFDDYGRSISLPPSTKESSVASKIVKAVPKVETQEDVKGGVLKFRVKLLAESGGQSTTDVLCQIGLDGIRMLDPNTSRTLRIYPLENITRCDRLDSSTLAFWSKSPVDIEPRRIRLQSNSYTTNTLLDTMTAATIQFKEMGGSRRPAESVKTSEQPTEIKKGLGDWMNLIKPANEEKDHWVPDEAVSKCTACGTDFGAFVRKHHCRNCGDIFCDKCTQGRIALTADENAQPVRVCDRCMAEVTQRLSSAKEASSKPVLQTHEDLARKLQEELERNRRTSGNAMEFELESCFLVTSHDVSKVAKNLLEDFEINVRLNKMVWFAGSKSDGSGRRMKEVECPICTVHLQVQVPSSGSETIECGVCQHPFLVSAH